MLHQLWIVGSHCAQVMKYASKGMRPDFETKTGVPVIPRKGLMFSKMFLEGITFLWYNWEIQIQEENLINVTIYAKWNEARCFWKSKIRALKFIFGSRKLYTGASKSGGQGSGSLPPLPSLDSIVTKTQFTLSLLMDLYCCYMIIEITSWSQTHLPYFVTNKG